MSDIILRRAEKRDVEQIMEIIESAKAYMKDCGVNQWQDGYPNRERIETDIAEDIAYVLCDNGEICAFAAIAFTPERTYADIDGKWLNDEPYAVIHRSAVSGARRGTGCGRRLMERAEELCKTRGCKNIRIDTHRDNKSMARLLGACGYIKCGVITLEDRAESDILRDGYHKVLK